MKKNFYVILTKKHKGIFKGPWEEHMSKIKDTPFPFYRGFIKEDDAKEWLERITYLLEVIEKENIELDFDLVNLIKKCADLKNDFSNMKSTLLNLIESKIDSEHFETISFSQDDFWSNKDDNQKNTWENFKSLLVKCFDFYFYENKNSEITGHITYWKTILVQQKKQILFTLPLEWKEVWDKCLYKSTNQNIIDFNNFSLKYCSKLINEICKNQNPSIEKNLLILLILLDSINFMEINYEKKYSQDLRFKDFKKLKLCIIKILETKYEVSILSKDYRTRIRNIEKNFIFKKNFKSTWYLNKIAIAILQPYDRISEEQWVSLLSGTYHLFDSVEFKSKFKESAFFETIWKSCNNILNRYKIRHSKEKNILNYKKLSEKDKREIYEFISCSFLYFYALHGLDIDFSNISSICKG
ncbi:hypothetical protein SSABA_v1c04320 [Spiroplasma sabaudiense Ar-1343]|uniref:Uncharacterized protein n=1 Tax=Spiroplasma sabaudiense Ar-1343 TaxID=1276257 RepID=W6AJE5_9MOLU|nr:hypothetical protein [Spiroplasma sabaudiense]AHI53839.1 hypothetical protein SSABA_v1c04320 [Spiroplasma sabaudiense Ar-1343]